MNSLFVHPAFLMIAGAFMLPLIKKKLQPLCLIVISIVTFSAIYFTSPDASLIVSFAGNNLTLFSIDKISRLFGLIFSSIALAGALYSFHIKDVWERVFTMLYCGSTLGLIFAGDLYTLFIFWELMAISSALLNYSKRDSASRKSGDRYLIFHLLGGGILLSGILLHSFHSGTYIIEKLNFNTVSSILIFIGVGINAAIVPLHTWLADTYPKSSITGAVFLSVFTTKSAVYILVKLFPGWEVLIFLGVIMSLYGSIYAIISNDIREILSYHVISQIGFMVLGVGMGSEIAIDGSIAHAFNNILYKTVLFMAAGAVMYKTGKSKLTELGGLFKTMKMTVVLYMIAAFSISGFPLFNGFISKSMILDSIINSNHKYVLYPMLLASMGTFISVGLKLPYFAWFHKAEKSEQSNIPIPKNMYIGMALLSFFCLFYGIYPKSLIDLLPNQLEWSPFTVHHIVETIQILSATFLVFWILRKKLKPKTGVYLDLDWIYRKPLSVFAHKVLASVQYSFIFSEKTTNIVISKIVKMILNPSCFNWLHRPSIGTILIVIMSIMIIVSSSVFL